MLLARTRHADAGTCHDETGRVPHDDARATTRCSRPNVHRLRVGVADDAGDLLEEDVEFLLEEVVEEDGDIPFSRREAKRR